MSVYCRINVEHFGAPYCSALMLLTALFQPAFPRLLYLPHCRSEAHAIPRFQLALCLTTTQRKTAVKAETLFYRQPLLWVCPWRSRDITLHKGEADTLIWMGVDARLFAWFVFLLVCVCVNLLWPQLPFSSTRPLLPLPDWWQPPRWRPRQPGCPRSPWLPQLLPPPKRGAHRALLP